MRPSWPDIPDFTYAAEFTFGLAGWLHADSKGQDLHCQPLIGKLTPPSMAFSTPTAVRRKSASACSSRRISTT
jgi:hypothetical protein